MSENNWFSVQFDREGNVEVTPSTKHKVNIKTKDLKEILSGLI